MNRVFTSLVNAQLKVKFPTSPQEYHGFVTAFGSECFTHFWYWDILPEYIISRCPICLVPYKQAIDTYSLYFWDIRHDMSAVRYSKNGYKRCSHFVGVHTFLNLNGERPRQSEMRGETLFSSEPEVPMVTPTLLPDDIKSYAVLHSLPLCRIWGGRFLPKYTLYMITYYSTDPKILEFRRLMEWTGGRKITSRAAIGAYWTYGHRRLGIYWEEAEARPQAWDLQHWVEKGKLRWLDLTRPDLPLNHSHKEEFPYEAIAGVRHGYKYQDGIYEVVPTQPTIEEFQRNLQKNHSKSWNQDIASFSGE